MVSLPMWDLLAKDIFSNFKGKTKILQLAEQRRGECLRFAPGDLEEGETCREELNTAKRRGATTANTTLHSVDCSFEGRRKMSQ